MYNGPDTRHWPINFNPFGNLTHLVIQFSTLLVERTWHLMESMNDSTPVQDEERELFLAERLPSSLQCLRVGLIAYYKECKFLAQELFTLFEQCTTRFLSLKEITFELDPTIDPGYPKENPREKMIEVFSIPANSLQYSEALRADVPVDVNLRVRELVRYKGMRRHAFDVPLRMLADKTWRAYVQQYKIVEE